MLKPFASLLTNVLFLIVLIGLLTWIVQTISFLDTSASGWPMSIYRLRGAIPMSAGNDQYRHEQARQTRLGSRKDSR